MEKIKTWVETWTWIETLKMNAWRDFLRHWLRYLDMDRDMDLRCQVEGGRNGAGLLAWVNDPTFACDKLGFDEGVRARSELIFGSSDFCFVAAAARVF
jgi:hypothetical protein